MRHVSSSFICPFQLSRTIFPNGSSPRFSDDFKPPLLKLLLGQPCSCRGQLSPSSHWKSRNRGRLSVLLRLSLRPLPIRAFVLSLLLSGCTNDASFTRAIPSAPRVPGSLFEVEAPDRSGHQLHFLATAR